MICVISINKDKMEFVLLSNNIFGEQASASWDARDVISILVAGKMCAYWN